MSVVALLREAPRRVGCVKFIFGLGNPGEEYVYSPHNLGFQVVGCLARRHSVRVTRKEAKSLSGRFAFAGKQVWLIKPQTFMNLSGMAVQGWFAKQGCRPEDMLVIADDLDLPWGCIRIRQQGGAGGHHGLESVIEAAGSQQFTRLRMGICPERPIRDTVRYVLAPFKKSQMSEAEEMVERAADAVEAILSGGAAQAMNLFNRRRPVSGEPCRQASSEIET